MKIFHLPLTLLCLTMVVACGGGGGGGSSAPAPAPAPPPASPGTVIDDALTLEEDNSVTIDVLANDSNVNASSLSIETEPQNGAASVSNGAIAYTPAKNYVGEDSFTYTVDGDDGVSVTAEVVITVTAITITTLEVRQLSIPASGYVSTNDAELNRSVLSSPVQELTVPPNTVSVLINLSGAKVGYRSDELFISSVIPPSGPFEAFQRRVNYCAAGLCSALVPRRPDQSAEAGTWQFRVGTTGSSLEAIDLTALSLTVVIRTGPEPDKSLARPAAITVRPYLTSTTLTVADIESVMARYHTIAEANQIEVIIDPVTQLNDPDYGSVSSDFTDAVTAALVSEGQSDTVNLFFIEAFTDTSSLVGRTGGIPGKPGSQNAFNGTLLDVVTLRGGPDEFFFNSAADIAFHESGHLLGLYHTTEGDFTEVDVLDDTPFCERSVHDSDDNGIAAVSECPDGLNPMFWTTDLNAEKELLTEDQKHVIFYSPLAIPGS